jgi:hypothetical protein
MQNVILYLQDSTEPVIGFGTSAFVNIRKTTPFIDKTMLIKAVFRAPSGLFIRAPRHFGKRTDLVMFEHFVEIQVDNNE